MKNKSHSLAYQLLDAGEGEKWEQFGPYQLIRPAPSALFPKKERSWKATAHFSREEKKGWTFFEEMEKEWIVSLSGIEMELSLTDFGHLGLFPEQGAQWQWIQEQAATRKRAEVLNLFAYSGGATLAAAKAGASCCHLDASKGMIDWARKNAEINGLTSAPIRWICEDVVRFVKREIKRGRKYDGIILDPPSFGRGAKGEVFKIEEEVIPLLHLLKELLTEKPLFVLFSCHTPGYTPIVLKQLLETLFSFTNVESGEMVIPAKSGRILPSGTFARWSCHGN